ncbi:hypothetical protein M6G53_17260, partial [Serratia nevei]|uniref:hypothetical protein n=1 Tax=Serratia nevei TaxID=2703794 RepID=UPI0020A012AA
EEQQSPLLTPMLASAARLKLPVLPQVGPNYIGMWVIFTSVLTIKKVSAEIAEQILLQTPSPHEAKSIARPGDICTV